MSCEEVASYPHAGTETRGQNQPSGACERFVTTTVRYAALATLTFLVTVLALLPPRTLRFRSVARALARRPVLVGDLVHARRPVDVRLRRHAPAGRLGHLVEKA